MLKTSNPSDCYKICRVTKTDRNGHDSVHYIVKYLWHFFWFFPVWLTETNEYCDDDNSVLEFHTLEHAKKHVEKGVKNAMKDVIETKIECDVN